MKRTVDEVMLQSVERARQQLKEAQDKKDKRIADIQKLAKSSINIFAGNALSRVNEICTRTENALEDFYTSCQMLVAFTDKECRALLDENPDVMSVYEVYLLIKTLNEESEITNTFTGQLDSSSLGDMAVVNYKPSLESKMIEKLWEQSFKSMPGSENAERVKKEQEAEKRRAKQAQENAVKSVKDRAAKAFSDIKSQYSHAESNKAINKLKEECESQVSQKVEQYKKGALEYLEGFKQVIRKERDEEVEALRNKVQTLKSSKDKDKKAKIKQAKAKILSMSTDEYIDKQVEKCESKITADAESYKKQLEEYIKKRFVKTTNKHKVKNPSFKNQELIDSLNKSESNVYLEIKVGQPLRTDELAVQLSGFMDNKEIFGALREIKRCGLVETRVNGKSEHLHTTPEYLNITEEEMVDKGISEPVCKEYGFKKSDYKADDYLKTAVEAQIKASDFKNKLQLGLGVALIVAVALLVVFLIAK